jgi:phenylacetaldehyde dehydrogenase
MLVFEDAEVEDVVEATQQSVFFNTGQVCSAGSRLYVHRTVHAKVVKAIADRAAAMVVGNVLSEATEMGPAISKSQRDSVNAYIALGIKEGADLVCGGVNNQSPGYWLTPTILDNCNNEMSVVQEEIFGPVLVVIPFDSEKEGIALANDNQFGLAASVFTRDISRATRVTRSLDAGTVWINTHDLIDANTPFGGVKQSGYGKDLGPEQLLHFLNTKSVWCRL